MFRGPTGDDHYFMGYREEKMLCVLITIFAAIGYWSRITARVQGSHKALDLSTLQYVDYLATCPLVTVDMLWSLNLPYKFTWGALVFLCILSAFACDAMEGQARWMWFGVGMGLFSYVWISVGRLVKFRLTQLAALRAEGVLKVDIEYPLKVGTATFFFLWFAYPLMWLLEEFDVINHAKSEVAHVVFDVVVKSVYAICLQEFGFRCDRTYFEFPSMSVTVVPDEEYQTKNEHAMDEYANERLQDAWHKLPVNETQRHTVPKSWHCQGSMTRLPLSRVDTLNRTRSHEQDDNLKDSVSALAAHARSAKSQQVAAGLTAAEEEELTVIPEQSEHGIEITMEVKGVQRAGIKLIKEEKSGEANTPPETTREETPTQDLEAGGVSEDQEAGALPGASPESEIQETRQQIDGIDREVARLKAFKGE